MGTLNLNQTEKVYEVIANVFSREDKMICDRCDKLIDEDEGYLTIHSNLEITWSRRVGGNLINDPAIKPEVKREHVCMKCARNNPIRKRGGE